MLYFKTTNTHLQKLMIFDSCIDSIFTATTYFFINRFMIIAFEYTHLLNNLSTQFTI